MENEFRKIRKFFLRKKKCFRKTETVPKWNDLEHILLSLEHVLVRSEMERSRIYSASFETLSLYFGRFSLLSNKFHLWTHSWSSADKSLVHQKTICKVTRRALSNGVLQSEVSTGQDFLSCPASYLRPGGRQDRTKTKNASCPTGLDTRTACPVLSSGSNSL